MYDFAVVDTETTGLPNRRHNRIVEVAVVRLSPSLQVVGEFETLLNPKRDSGPTSIHGISSQSIIDAPCFEDVAGDLMDSINGCVLVAHNAPFDAMFLRAEFERIGLQLPELPIVCTMKLARCLGKAWLSVDLESCCATLGIDHIDPHRALSDARVTAELFRQIARHLFSNKPINLKKLDCRGKIPWSVDCECLKRSGRRWTREQAESENAGPCPQLSKMVYRLAGMIRINEVKHEVAGYLDVLDHVLEDRLVTKEEAENLFEAAKTWDLTPEEVVEAHRLYMRRLAVAALADGIVTNAERSDLQLVNRLLGFDELFLQSALHEAQTSRSVAQSNGKSLAGMTVCFTGECSCTIHGEYISRAMAAELAAKAGLSVKGNVTKQLDLLVVADPHTQSGKAKKARKRRSNYPRATVLADVRRIG